ncbi:MAG: TIM barrel protein [Candidatus Omnitrophica bacterium]|nr:TIM barrel protein [Candidatus Omnitrophota bacterium]
MRLGIIARTFARPTLAEVFDAVRGHGIDCVQFNFSCAGLPNLPDQIEPAKVDQVCGEARQHQLAIVAVSGTFNMIHPDPEHRRDGLRRLRVIAAACQRLGAPLITLCTGTRDAQNM